MTAAVFICLGGAFVVTILGSFFVSLYMETFAARLKTEHEKSEAGRPERGFPDGGKLIGQLERFLIYLFVLAGRPEGVGFLVAAKSVFRFGELTKPANRLEAEYITIGTLMSFSWGLAVALVTKLWIDAVLG
jgi:hypothetical protein